MSRANYDERWFFPTLDRPGVITRWVIGTIGLVVLGTIVQKPEDWVISFISMLNTWCPLSFLLLLTFGYGGKWLKKLPITWSWVAWLVLTCTYSLCVAAINQEQIFVTWAYLLERLIRDIFFVFLLLYFFDGEHRRGSSSWAKAKIDILQARMRPHFLFNTLNNLAEIVRFDQEAAEEALLDLADLSRSMLQKNPEIRAIEEKNNTMSYIRLEKIRMGDRLNVDWDWKIGENIRMPAFLLQPLLENSIKYGIEPLTEKDNKITVKGWEDNKFVNILISNPKSKQKIVTKPGNGVTLPNISERLEWLYPNKHRFRTHAYEDRFEVIIRIPKSYIK